MTFSNNMDRDQAQQNVSQYHFFWKLFVLHGINWILRISRFVNFTNCPRTFGGHCHSLSLRLNMVYKHQLRPHFLEYPYYVIGFSVLSVSCPSANEFSAILSLLLARSSSNSPRSFQRFRRTLRRNFNRIRKQMWNFPIYPL